MNISEYENNVTELNKQAFACYQEGNLENAKGYFEQLKSINPFDKDTYFNLAKVSYEMGSYSESINILHELLELGESDDEVLGLLGDAYFETANFSEAIICYQRMANKSAVQAKIEAIREYYKKENDKLYLQYMNYPYPNVWKKIGIPKSFNNLKGLSPIARRQAAYANPYHDINFLQLKYLEKQKGLNKIRVLNAGCGTGESLLSGAFFYPEVEYVAIDISENSINIAKEHAKELDVTNVSFMQKDITKLDPEEIGYFDIIVSTGVLHHLYSPQEGIISLKGLLKEDGILAGMVYATMGRREVYDFRDIFGHLFSEVEQMQYKLGAARQLINSLQPWQLLDRIKLCPDINWDEGTVDLLLNENETSYNTSELIDLFNNAGFNIDFYDQSYLDPLYELYNINSNVLRKRLTLLDNNSQVRIGEIINGSIYKHFFVTYKKEFNPKENYLFSDGWLDAYPILWHGAKLLQDGQSYFVDLSFNGERAANCSRFTLDEQRIKKYSRYDVSKECFEFLQKCNGKNSIREIFKCISYTVEIPLVKKMLLDLNNSQALFISKDAEINYQG